ncbi:hypothetical protein GNI_016550 [Gregarina niphandrodes]|uniref:Uncharacterized protein n=1 Tax=Gregarina niphandrodes TaxID=110365 RepID=A0A023BCD6_GRENI|nr:hypothetical protein GNI_016550 [Gregarina niphandrodes]EZG82430.1 hypothetical protein GNI_016550 [Gregarina niphandrodes]|eukprot:XP_011128999.1 hypothetical protein GNI_016550 [Gregarina niphandrodes]
MKTTKCRSEEAGLWMRGVVAFLNGLGVPAKPSELQEEAPFGAAEAPQAPWGAEFETLVATLTVGPRARAVTMHHMRNLLASQVLQDGPPEEVVERFRTLCAQALTAERQPGPFYLRRVVEEYEQWTHAGISEVREWLESDVTAEAKVRRLKRTYKWLASHAAPPRTLQDAAIPMYLFPANDGSCRIMRSPPALARWAHYLRSARDMTPQRRLKTLLVLSRWNPIQACQAVRPLHEMTCVHEHILSSLENLNQRLTITDNELRETAAAAFYDTEAAGTPEAEAAATPAGAPTVAAGVSGVAGQVDEAFEQTVADVAEFISAMKESLNADLEEFSTVSGVNRKDLIESRIRERSSWGMLQRWMNKLAARRFRSLRKRYSEAYEQCTDRFLATYFDNAVDEFGGGEFPVAGFPVGSEVKIHSFADYRNRDLRDRAWMEEVLVRGLVHVLRSYQEPAEFVTRLITHETVTFTLPILQVYEAYETAASELVDKVALEQAYEYAARALMVLLVTLSQQLTSPPQPSWINRLVGLFGF